MKFLVFFSLLFLGFQTWASPLSFNGALSLEICPRNSDCFRKNEGLSFNVPLNNIYDDNDVSIDYGSWESTTSIQNIEVTGGVEITKTTYKQSGDIYWEYLTYTKEASGLAKAKNVFSYKEPSQFDGVLTITGSVINSNSPLKQYPVFIMTPAGTSWKEFLKHSSIR